MARPIPKLLAALLIIAVPSLWLATPAAAEETTFSQKILPLNCIFTTINAGTGELYYVTPEACGVVVNNPPQTQPGQTLSNIPAKQSNNLPTFFVPSTTNAKTSSQNLYLPWQPLVTVRKSAATNVAKPTSLGLIKVIAAVIVLLLLIVAVIIL